MAKKILIIDDEKDLLEMLTFRLKAQGFEVFSALDGPSGIEKAKSDKPDLILLDIMMPGLDGYAVAKILKADKTTSGIPIIVFTAAVTPDLSQKVCEIHAIDCITKPFEPQVLLAKIAELLEKK